MTLLAFLTGLAFGLCPFAGWYMAGHRRAAPRAPRVGERKAARKEEP